MKTSCFLILLLAINTMTKAQNNDPWAIYMTPAEKHAVLSGYTGQFTMEFSMSMGEGKAPMLITLESEHSMLLGGRFLEMKQRGKMMGMDYAAIMTLGYNTIDKRFPW